MTLRKDEYMIKGDSIIIPKKVLERFRDHYQSVADARKDKLTFYYTYYSGKATVLTDLLKLFEPLEG